MTQKQLGDLIGISDSLIGMIERGERVPKTDDLAKAFDRALDAKGSLLQLWPDTQKAELRYPKYAESFFDAMRHASIMRVYHPTLIPGVLQTQEYARTIIRAANTISDDETIDDLVFARMERRKEVVTESRRPVIWVILDEGAIWRMRDDPGILRGQVRLLIDLVESGRIELQTVPTGVGIRRHPGLSGPFTILSFKDASDTVYVEGVGSGSLISKRETVEEISFKFGKLQAVALPVDQSLKLLHGIIKENE
ncbi:helix-turn-helix protein [Allonocardiopsis opalescens]|uniref:Helix-turn-helix protein n=2 Tax=Allonocardiopsis opalescens TaxID=1144618 RepID=A0A2T0QCD0_9ACTN|nr:helix-turn-helix protein [Allonocardiopsis opalescens]